MSEPLQGLPLNSPVVDTLCPGIYGKFQGFIEKNGRQFARVRFGEKTVTLPAVRIKSVKQRGPKPRLKDQQYAKLHAQHGITREELHRRARLVGLSVHEAFHAFDQCGPECECEACTEAAEQ